MKRTNFFKGMSIALILSMALGCGSLAAFAASEEAASSDAVPPVAAETETEAAATHTRKAEAEIEAAVSEEDALAAALKDAGLSEEDVTVTRTRLREKENEEGETIPVYTVKFHTEDTTYKYHVDGNTGKVIDSTVTEGVSEGRVRGERGRASGEMSDAASAEPTDSADTEAVGGHGGRRGGKTDGRGVDAETSASPEFTDTTDA